MPIDEPPEDNPKTGRLSRWSRRKLAIKEEEARQDLSETESDELLQQEALIVANREAAEAIDIETLDSDSDFSVFLKDGVPDLLKRKALATLWRSNPVLANVDGLVDYDDDFGSSDLNMKIFKSAYQAGRGYLEHIERQAADTEKAPDGDAESANIVKDLPETDEPDEDGAEVEAADLVEQEDAPEEIPAEEEPDADDEGEPEAVRVSLRQRLELDVPG